MIAFVRRNLSRLILNPNLNNVYESPLHYPLYFKKLSTSSENEYGISRKLSEILVQKHNIDPEFVSRVASKLTQVKNAENAGLVLSFLKESGFPDYRLERIVNYRPRLLCVSLEDSIRPKINFFQKMGLSSDDISRMISGHPEILSLSLNDNIIPSMALLKGLFGSNDEVARVIRMAPKILPANLENNVLPNFNFFKSCGVPIKRIRMTLMMCPRGFLRKPEVMRRSAKMAEGMGIDASSNSFIYAVLTIASMSKESWKLKLQAFRSLGFSESDVVIMFRKAPLAFRVSMEKMKKIKELLLDTNKYTMSSIVDCPQSLQFSIEKRYMPRLQVLGILGSRNLIQHWPSIYKLCQSTVDEFSKEYIIPYSEELTDVNSVANSVEEEKR